MISTRFPMFLTVIVILAGCVSEKNSTENSGLMGPYLGQSVPADTAELFAESIVSTPLYARDITFTPDGKEIYFCVSAMGFNLIYMAKEVSGVWSDPQLASFITNTDYMFYEPHITPDGNRLLFLSNMPEDDDSPATEDIWAVDRQGDGWGEAYNLGAPVNTEGSEFYPSTTRDGTLYFTRAEKGSRTNEIFRSRLVNGTYAEPEKLGPEINIGTNRYNAFIDPQERFMIIPAVGLEDSRGGTDYYISFRNDDDTWSQAVNMGDRINSENGREFSSSLSPDGEYLFFMSARAGENRSPEIAELQKNFASPLNGNSNIYWISSDFIWGLKPQDGQGGSKH
ncbi:MAG: hypothetical protein K9M49_01530 [Candidatus Marinimicrobia bacterium]|nr:hypothetical protein [Candidatus Neomarinimicrobiota bacterium]MCF7850294.1 hypothetical protein [Candidatus Neomarinimicrobiota bacterium]MCF7903809.1 hypothetical protein [Candidatus Neomarinimicrobiota bacterium]